MLDRMGVPFNRTPEGLLDFRRFGGTLFHRTAFAGATTGQQLLYALDEQVRRWETVDVEDDKGERVPGEKMVRKFEWWDFLALVLDDEGVCRGIVAQDLKTMAIEAFPGDAVCLATGGCGIVFGRSTNSVINTGTAASAAYQQGACYANGEFIQVHPTAIPGADKLRLISESVRGEGGRVWVPRDSKEQRPGRDVPESERDYFLEDKYPGYGNLVPRDIASRELFKKCFHEKRGVYNAKSGKNENEVYLDVTHLPTRGAPQEARGRPRDLREVRRRGSVRRTRCASSRPCTTRWAASGSTSSARANGSLVMGSPRNQATNIPGLYAVRRGRLPVPRRQPARRQLAPLVHLGRHGHGPRDRGVPQEHRAGARGTCRRRSSTRREKREQKKYEAILAMNGDENPYALHEELAQTMLVDCTIERAQRRRSTGAREDRGDRRALAAASASPTRRTGKMNQGAQFVRHLQQHDRPRARHRAGRAQPRRVARRALQAGVHRSATTPTGSARRSRSTRAASNGSPDSRALRARVRLRARSARRST